MTHEALLPWLILGAIGLVLLGLLIRMVLAARFPRGYRDWAHSRRESFEERNRAWDRQDEDRHP